MPSVHEHFIVSVELTIKSKTWNDQSAILPTVTTTTTIMAEITAKVKQCQRRDHLIVTMETTTSLVDSNGRLEKSRPDYFIC